VIFVATQAPTETIIYTCRDIQSNRVSKLEKKKAAKDQLSSHPAIYSRDRVCCKRIETGKVASNDTTFAHLASYLLKTPMGCVQFST